MSPADSELVLVLAPRGDDAPIITAILRDAGIVALPCDGIDHLCREVSAIAGAALVALEALTAAAVERLKQALDQQPSWSEIPIIALAAPGLGRRIAALDPLSARANVTVIDRPTDARTLVGAARSALQARRRQYQVRSLMEELEGRIHERDKFLAILGHELRNPLEAILLASQRTRGEAGLDEEHAALIERQALHLSRLVEDLLDLSRVTAGKIMLHRVPVDLRHVVSESHALAREAAAAQRVEIRFAPPEDPVTVQGDPVRLEQIVSNLLTNAVKYTPAGGHVDIRLERAGAIARLSIADTGVGIEPARIGSIFGLFTQAENAIGRAQGGMGIGLSLVRNLVDLHGGSVAASSEGIDKGSTFVVELPICDEAPRPPAPTPVDLREAPAPLDVVLVEDNADLRALLEHKLRKLGHAVEGFGLGEDGIERITLRPPDLGLIDIGLPDIEGYDVARRVREALGPGVHLVALSGFGQPEDRQRAINAGFDEHLTKPIDMKGLVALLSRVRRGAVSSHS